MRPLPMTTIILPLIPVPLQIILKLFSPLLLSDLLLCRAINLISGELVDRAARIIPLVVEAAGALRADEADGGPD